MRIVSFFLLWLALFSCYEPQEGCLDRNAIDYDVDADFACPDNSCCEYPRLALRFRPLWNQEAYSADSIYTDAEGNDFRIDRLRFYVSEVAFLQQNGDTLTPTNLVSMGLLEASGDTVFQNLNSNLALVRSQPGDRWSFGNYTDAVTASQLLYRFGLAEPYSRVVPETMPANHALARQEGLLNFSDGQGYVMAKLEYSLIRPDTTIARVLPVFGSRSEVLSISGGLDVPAGQRLTLDLDVDYQQLLGPLDLSGDSLTLVDAVFFALPQVVTYNSFSLE